jgi:amino acid transporter
MNDSKLVRSLGKWDLTAIAINTIIGTGIFILPARVTGLIGSYSLIAFVACALIIGLIVLCYAEVSSRFRSTGGMYLYAREAFGPVVGFEVGWLYWIVRVATIAANTNAFLIYLGFFFPDIGDGALRIAIIVAVVSALTLVNLIGVRESAIVTNIFTVGKIVPLIVFAVVGFFFIQPANFSFGGIPEYGKASQAILLLLYAYFGFEAAVIPAGESKDPQRNLPFALLAALGFVTLLFIAVQLVALGTLPGLAESKTPLADAASTFLSGFGGAFIAIGALVSILGNLNGGFLAASRLPFAMAEQRELPSVVAKTHQRFKTPYVAIIITSVAILILTIYSTFFTAVTIATITRLLVYATTCLALPVFRRRTDIPEARFTAPLGVAAAVLSLGLIAWLLTNVEFAKEGLPIVVAGGVGLIIYFAYKVLGHRASPAGHPANDENSPEP